MSDVIYRPRTDTRGRRLDAAQRKALQALIKEQIRVSPRHVGARVHQVMQERLGFLVSYATITYYWRAIVEKNGNAPLPDTGEEDETEIEVPPPAAASLDAGPPPLPPSLPAAAPRRKLPPSRVRPPHSTVASALKAAPEGGVVLVLPPATRVLGAKELILSALERVNEYNRGFADCYLALAGRGLAMPGLAKHCEASGLETLTIAEVG